MGKEKKKQKILKHEKSKKAKRILPLICFLAILFAAVYFVLPATAFDGNDYDGGGGWGGGGGGGWGGGDSWSSDEDGGGGSLIGTLIVLGVIVILYFVLPKSKNKNKGGQAGQAGQTGQVRRGSDSGMHVTLPDRTHEIEHLIRGHDPNFGAADFITFAKRLYIDIQLAWCRRDLASLRVFLHDNLYDTTARQIQTKIAQGVIYHYESMVVNTAYLTSYTQDRQFEHLTIYLNARMIDWQEDERTGKILRGDKTTRWDMRYRMKFVRRLGVLTNTAVSAATGHNCPNCGAPLEMKSSAHCTYCNSIITTGEYSWVLSDFETIRDDTRDEGIRPGGVMPGALPNVPPGGINPGAMPPQNVQPGGIYPGGTPPQAQPQGKFCPQCGNPVPHMARFCRTCGTQFN